jgi:hypothetical protein
MSVRPEQKEKGQVFIKVVVAGEVGNEVRFKSLVMERPPGSASEPTYLQPQNSLDVEPEAREYLNHEFHSTYKNHWYQSAEEPITNTSGKLKIEMLHFWRLKATTPSSLVLIYP